MRDIKFREKIKNSKVNKWVYGYLVDECHIRQEREKLVERLEKDNFEVVDTIISENAPKGCNEAIYYLSKSIEFISKVDIVYFMKGWEKARGCKIENKICQDYGKQTMYYIYEED